MDTQAKQLDGILSQLKAKGATPDEMSTVARGFLSQTTNQNQPQAPKVDTSNMPRYRITGKDSRGLPVTEFLNQDTGEYVPSDKSTLQQRGSALAEMFVDPVAKFVKSGLSAPIDFVRGIMGMPVLPNDGKSLPSGLPATTFQEDFQNKTLPAVQSGAITPLKGTADVTGNVVGGGLATLGAADLAGGLVSKTSNIADSAVSKLSNAKNAVVDTIKGKIGGRTAEQVLSTPEAEVGKLSPDEQKLWYKNQAQSAAQTATEAAQKAKLAMEQDTANVEKSISDFNQKIGETSRDAAISLKEPAKQLMRDSSAKYVELTGEAADGSPALKKTIASDDLSAAIDSKFEYNPEVGTSLKQELGLNETPKTEIDPKTKLPVIQTKVKTLTNQQILDKAREIMTSVSKSAKQGGKTYSFAEYQATQKYGFLMEQLAKNGVDMAEANRFWKEWAPVRDRIVREIKPFDESNIQKMPFTSTLNRAASTAKTSLQVASKADAQNFIAQIESRLGLKPGTIGSEVRSAVEGLEKAKLSKENIAKVTKDVLEQIKTDKAEALKKMSLNQYNTLRQARVNTIIKRVLIGAGIWAAAKATGVDKAVIGAVTHVL